MRVQEPSEDLADRPSPSPPSPDRPLATLTRKLALVALVGGLVAGFFLAIYLFASEPIGWDTARYLDQTNLATKWGLSGAAHLVLPRPSQLLGSRVGFPTTVMGLGALLHTSLFSSAALVQAAAAVAIALAAGAFVSYSLRRGVWELAVVALVVGTSAALVRLMGGTYTDNLIAEALFAAALVPALSSVRDGRGFAAGVLLIAIGGLAHPAFYAFMLGVLALVAVAYLPESWRAWRRKDAALLGTPSARLAVLLAGSGAITAIGIYGFLGAVPDQPALQRRTFLQRFKDDLPLYRFYLTAPLAAAGAGSLWRSSRPTVADGRGQGSGQDPNRFAARFVLLLFLAWTVATAVGILGLLAGRALPAHRFLAFFLPLPILAALGVLAVCRFLRTRTTRSAAIGVAALCVVALMALGGLDYHVIARRGVEVLDDGKVHDAVAASTYLNALRVPVDAPVIVVITDTGPQPQLVIPEEAHMLRSAFQPERVPHLYFYVGRPDLALAGQPTLVPNDVRRFNVVSTRFFNSLQPILNQEPIVLLLASYNPAFNDLLPLHPDWIVAQDVMALRGPRPLAPVAVPPFPTAPHRAALPLLGSAALVVLALLGMGWALALLPAGVRPFEVLALSLSFGLALLIVAGIAADALGVRLVGWGAVLPAVILSLVGWAACGARVTRHGLASVLAL